MTTVHYYDEDYPTDHEHAPLCKQGRPGDEMTMFVDLTQCARCEAILFGDLPESATAETTSAPLQSDESDRRMASSSADHAPDSPFGCTHDWGDRVAVVPGATDARLHICNLDALHDGDHICKCGDQRAPVPGPPPVPKCRECRRVVGHVGHHPDCSIGQEQRAHFGNVSAVEVALKKAIDARRQDRPFMERLAARLRVDANILDALASDEIRTDDE